MPWFKEAPIKSEYQYLLVNENPTSLVEDEESIRSLKNHPGFQSLNNRLRKAKLILEHSLKEPQTDLRSVDRLQIGIRWMEFLQDEVDRAIGRKREVEAITPSVSDTEQFNKVLSFIQGV